MRRAFLLVPLLLALIIGGLLLNGVTASSPVTKISKTAATRVLGVAYKNCNVMSLTWRVCVQDKLDGFLPEVGVPAAVDYTLDFYHTNIQAPHRDWECHELLHYIGRYSASHYDSIQEALAPGHLECELGFQHGVIEQRVANAKQTGDTLKVCDPLIGNLSSLKLVINDCYHGIGHGLVTRYDYDVIKAIDICSKMPDDDGRNGCSSGALMAWSNMITDATMSGKQLPKSKIPVPVNEQWLICALIDPSVADGCTNFTAETIPQTVQSYAAFGKYCKDVVKHTIGCVAGIGRLVGARFPGPDLLSAKKMVQYCKAITDVTGDKLDECLSIAIGVRYGFDSNPTQVSELCTAAPSVNCAELNAWWDRAKKNRVAQH